MSAKHDAEREERWKDAGNSRLTMRISRKAEKVIQVLQEVHRCTRRDVVEGLLLGTISIRLTAQQELMRDHGLSVEEAKYFLP